jgi:hypothetical protein
MAVEGAMYGAAMRPYDQALSQGRMTPVPSKTSAIGAPTTTDVAATSISRDDQRSIRLNTGFR